jgi:hypothetical protein
MPGNEADRGAEGWKKLFDIDQTLHETWQRSCSRFVIQVSGMLAAIFTVLLIHFGLGGGSFSFEKAFEPFLKEAVAEQSRYEQAIQLTKEADENFEQFRKEVTEVRAKELKTLIADYDATDEQFRQFFENRGFLV